MAEGQHPETGKQLIKHREFQGADGRIVPHRAGWDMTFGASKSVSAAAIVGGDTRIVDAHQAAVRKALDRIELYAQARMRDGQPVTTERMAFALFLHDTARPVNWRPDPHLHTHAVGFNMTLDGGKFRSIDPREMFRIQSFASAVYHSEMAARLKELGYELQHGRNFSVEIKGFSPEYLRAISSRTDEIERYKKEHGLHGAEADEIVNRKLRNAKELWKPEALLAEYRKQAEEMGEQPERITNRAKQGAYAIRIDQDRQNLMAHSGITFAKRRLQERTAVFEQWEVYRDALRYGMGKLRIGDVERAFASRTRAGKGEFIPVDHYRAHAPGERYTTPEMRRMERDVLEFMRAGRDQSKPLAPKNLTREAFRDHYRDKLSNAQLHVVWHAIRSPDRVFGINGAAGSGKTFSLSYIRRFVESAGYEAHGLATTSGAAKELASAGIKTETMQSFLLHGATEQKKPRIYFIDESSLVDTAQLWRFTEFLKASKPDDRIFLIGDRRQHQAVGPGRIFEELQMAGMDTRRTDKIIRQRSEELKEIVTAFSRGHTAKALTMLDGRKAIVQIGNRNQRFASIAKAYVSQDGSTLVISPDNESRQKLNNAIRQQLRAHGDIGKDKYSGEVYLNRSDVTTEDQKLAGTYNPGDILRFQAKDKMLGIEKKDYATVLSMDPDTNHVTAQLHKNGSVVTFDPIRGHYPVQVFVKQERSFAEGDRIQFVMPWKERRVANRDFGTIEKLDKNGNARVRLEDDRMIRFNLRDMPHIDYGYAMTSYSAQGKTVDRVLIHIDAGDSRVRGLVDKVLAYVGASRARDDIRIYTNDRADLEKALDRWAIKPKALPAREIHQYRRDVARELARGA